MKQLIAPLLAAATLNIGPALAAGSCSAQSPAYRVALLELYTSEGCSSCPPADQYLRELRAAGVTPQQAVVMSLHVDYWNYIGWKDPFSRAAFTERQRWMSDLAGSRTIYTPEFFIGGKELRGWANGVPAAVKRVNELPAQAQIQISLGTATAGALSLEVKASAARNAHLYVALVENGIASQVNAGENRGRLLHHDYVVREWLTPVPLTVQGKGVAGAASVAQVLALPAGAQGKQLAISAFVQSEQGEVLQALNLPLCGS